MKGNRTKGAFRRGGRKATSPNDLHTIARDVPLKRASELKARRGGKVRLSILVPPYLYDELRDEAVQQCRSLNSIAVECLEAGRASE